MRKIHLDIFRKKNKFKVENKHQYQLGSFLKMKVNLKIICKYKELGFIKKIW